MIMKFQSKLRVWVKEVALNSIIDEKIIAINFGLFEGDNGYNIYCIGSREYDKDDYDWACNEDYVPSKKYLVVSHSKINRLKWNEFHNFCVAELKNIFIEQSGNIPKNLVAITTGFDDGDLELVWSKNGM